MTIEVTGHVQIWPFIANPLFVYLLAQPSISWGDVMAFVLMMTVPVMVAFVLLERWLIQSVAGRI